MVRFVIGPDGVVWPDVAGKLPGRGMWVSADAGMLAEAVRRRAFVRAAKGAPAAVPDDLAARVEALLARRCLDLLGLARGAGLVRAGAEKVRARLAKGGVAALVQAHDGSASERAKIAALAREVPVVTLFGAGELGLALGRESVVHAALSSGDLAARFLGECARLAGFRPGFPGRAVPSSESE